MNIKEVLSEKLKNDAAFKEKLMRAPLETLRACGIDTESEEAQALLKAIQKENMETIEGVELDERQLEAVIGGGDGECEGTANCDYMFKEKPEETSRCPFWFWCDEFFC